MYVNSYINKVNFSYIVRNKVQSRGKMVLVKYILPLFCPLFLINI